ncbi:MAG: hypothetical protein AB7N99_02900 [Simkaniaceae bacterium]|jgi:hypothetical protein|nr:hypothetical protein [Chlamydiia bacterium]
MERKEKQKIYSTFKQDLEQFATNVQELIHDAELSTKREFLQKIADDVNRLYESSIQVQKAQDEDAEEIGAIVQNIFVQPLAVKAHGHISIKKAVETFEPEKEGETDLSYIMREYVTHPESTKSFVRELELLSEEFDTILRQIA